MKDINLGDYVFMETKSRTRRRSLEVRFKDGSRQWYLYGDRHIMALSPDESQLTVFYFSITIIFTGRHLLDMAIAIDGEHAEWVQEFDPLRFDRPAEDAPIIERVELFQPKKGVEKDSGN